MMESIKDNFANVLQASRERLKNPLFGYLIIAFIVYNWSDIYFLMFSDKSAEQKIKTIQNSYQINKIITPLIYGFIFSIALPYLTLLFEVLTALPKLTLEALRKYQDNSAEHIIDALNLRRKKIEYETLKKATDIDGLTEKRDNLLTDVTNANELLKTIFEQKDSLTEQSRTLKGDILQYEKTKSELEIETKKTGYTLENYNKALSLIDEKK